MESLTDSRAPETRDPMTNLRELNKILPHSFGVLIDTFDDDDYADARAGILALLDIPFTFDPNRGLPRPPEGFVRDAIRTPEEETPVAESSPSEPAPCDKCGTPTTNQPRQTFILCAKCSTPLRMRTTEKWLMQKLAISDDAEAGAGGGDLDAISVAPPEEETPTKLLTQPLNAFWSAAYTEGQRSTLPNRDPADKAHLERCTNAARKVLEARYAELEGIIKGMNREAGRLEDEVASLSSQLSGQREEIERLKGFEEVTTELSNELDAIVEIMGIDGNGQSISESVEAVFTALESDRAELERLKEEQLTPEERLSIVSVADAFPKFRHAILPEVLAKLRRTL